MSAYNLLPNEESFNIPTPKSDSTEYLSCIITIPAALTMDHYKHNLSPATHRAAILMHGIGGHLNDSYLFPLAKKLASEQGIYVVRFDFRNCGNSSKRGKLGRTLQDDLEDLQRVYEYIVNGGYKGTKLFVDVMVGHSRGVVDMFNWSLKHNYEYFVPVLVGCAGRFIGSGLADSIRKKFPNFEEDGNHYVKGFQNGEWTKVYVPLKETESLAELHMDTVKEINSDTDTLLVYGLEDQIIPLADSALYSNALGERCTLTLIPKANHSYYGVEKIKEEDWDKLGRPVFKSKGVIDYNFEVADIISDYLSPAVSRQRFYERSKMIHKFLPRWKEVEGICNFRDIGGFSTSEGKHVKYGLMFRCANPGNITDNGKETVSNKLKIRKVFDLRSTSERETDGILEAPGISNEHIPVFGDRSLAPKEEMIYYSNLLTSWSTYIEVYSDILKTGAPYFKTVFEYLRDQPNHAMLFHCTAGKDRTGVLSMLILSLLKVEPQLIAREYELTEIGLQPDYPKIKQDYLKGLKEFDEKTIEYVYSLTSKDRSNWTLEKEGFDNLVSSRYEAMLDTIIHMNESYGSVEKYLINHVGLESNDLRIIKENLLF